MSWFLRRINIDVSHESVMETLFFYHCFYCIVLFTFFQRELAEFLPVLPCVLNLNLFCICVTLGFDVQEETEYFFTRNQWEK